MGSVRSGGLGTAEWRTLNPDSSGHIPGLSGVPLCLHELRGQDRALNSLVLVSGREEL